MTITDKLKLELLIREAHQKHGDDFFAELERILSKIDSEQNQIPPVGRFRVIG
jgi:hypothetical protein